MSFKHESIFESLIFKSAKTDIKKHHRDFPVWSKWLRIYLPMQATQVQSLVGELRSHMPWGNYPGTLKLEKAFASQ